jgi:hypothetical protein
VAALRTAAGFVAGLGGDIIVAAPLIVPYPLPLQCPPVDRRVLVAQIQSAIVQSGIGCGVQNVLIAYTRDDHDAWRALLPAHCIVIVGKAGRWSPIRRFRAWRAAEYLRKLGHEVLVA